jgi:putative phosphoesterase
MLIGIVSDTHNNIKNIRQAISLFNKAGVSCVIHTGDITNTKSLEMFSALHCELYGVLGNNDRNEEGLEEAAEKYGFEIRNPPYEINIDNRTIAIFHEPDPIEDYLIQHQYLDIVLHGHTHRYREEYINETLLFNPGESAGILPGKNAIGIINLKNLSVDRIFF